MASAIETGHSKNVANFDELLVFVTGYGTDYNPSKNSIKPEALLSVSANAKNSLSVVNLVMPAYTNTVAAREAAFEPLSKLVTRLMNALKATDSTKQVIDSAQTLGRKLHGRRASPKKTEEEKKVLLAEGKKVTEISSSQTGYDNQLENFDKLIKLLASIILYAPNEEDLKVSSLTVLYTDLKNKNAMVIAAKAPLSNARILRNNILYKENTGLYDVASNVKSYVKSLYNATSAQFKQISKLKFTKINKSL